MCQEALDLERNNGEERTGGKSRKDKDHDLWYEPGPPAEFTRVCTARLQSAMLHASETWPLAKPNLQRLQRNDRAMIRQICNVGPQDITYFFPCS